MRDAEEVSTEVSGGFDAFYAREYEPLVRLALLLVGGSGDPEGLAQEAFARVQPRFSGLRNPGAYTRTTLINLCRRHHRQVNRERIAAAASRDDSLVTDDVHELLDVIDRLPFRQKAVVVLRYYDDLSEDAIAEVLGCRPGTIKSLAHRALERLRRELS